MAHTQGAGPGAGNNPAEPVTAELPVVGAEDKPRRTPGRGALVGAFGILAVIIAVAVVAALSLQRGWLGMSSTDEDEPAPAPAASSSTEAEDSAETSSSASSTKSATSSASSSASSSARSSAQSEPSSSRSSTRAAAADPTPRDSEPTQEVPAPRQYSSAAPGSEETSAAFADSVYSAFTSAYSQSGNPNTPVEAYSPVTGQWYKMQCTGNSNAVTCRGGNGAVVNIS
ncbi:MULTISPECIES: hypothetical protein [unclassified Corynebacterium]|uniref:hypothetical protein n=1 Tax=unclassified Corynebacterium TaxID=2624378 RepID=UPI0034CE216E